MKNSKYSVIAVIVFILIAGCKKKNQSETPPVTGKRCSNTIETYSGTTKLASSTMFYDENLRLVKLTTQGDTDLDYSYEQDKIKVSYLSNAYYEITLSNDRAVRISEIGKSNYQELTYNSDGYLGTVTNYSDNVLQQTVFLSYKNGNLTEVKTTFPNSADDKNGTVEYSSDLYSPRLAYINLLNDLAAYVPIEYLGKLSKNAVTKYSTITKPGPNRSEYVKTYTYTKDAGEFTTANEVYYTRNYKNGQLVGSNDGTFDYHFNFGCD